MEAKKVEILDELERLQNDLSCMTRTGKFCEELEMEANRGVKILKTGQAVLERKQISGRPDGPANPVVDLAGKELLTSSLQSRIKVLQGQLRRTQRRIDKILANPSGRRVFPRRRRRLGARQRGRLRRFLLPIALLFLIACGGRAPLGPVEFEFVQCRFDEDGCRDCVAATYENSFGEEESVFLSPQPLVVAQATRQAVDVWRGPEGRWNISVKVSPQIWEQLLSRIGSGSHDSFVAVVSRGVVLDVYATSTLHVSHGFVSFDFLRESSFEQARGALGVGEMDVRQVSFEDLALECRRAAGGSATAEARCLEVISAGMSEAGE